MDLWLVYRAWEKTQRLRSWVTGVLFAANIFGRSAFTNKKEPSRAMTLKHSSREAGAAKLPELHKQYAAGSIGGLRRC